MDTALLTPLVARIQADVGELLGLKVRLLAAQERATTAGERAVLQQLYAEQLEIEAQLQPALAAAQALAAGGLSLTAAATASAFYTALQVHLHRARAVLPAAEPASTVNWTKVLVYGGGALLGFHLVRKSAHGLLYVGLAVGAYLVYRRLQAPPEATP